MKQSGVRSNASSQSGSAGHSTRVHRFAESGITNRTLRGLGTLWGLRATGEEFPIEASVSKVESGGKKFFTVVIRDITERQRAEEALRASEERLRLAQQAARMGTFERDVRTGRITWAEGLEPLYGLSPGSLDGTTPEFGIDLIHPNDRQRVAQLIQQALTSGKPTVGEWRAIWPDDSVHWIASRWQVLMDDSGEPSRVMGVNMDATERKLAELALHAREELLRVFVKNVPAAVAMLDRDMRYLQVSDRWCSDYLPGAAEILGCSHYELFPDMPERWKEVHRRALQGETLRADEDRWDGQDGAHWARWEVRPWRTADGTVGGILILTEDITRRKKMEETLSKVNQKLIKAHEDERTRIARELHDDVCQRIALLAINLKNLQGHPATVTEVRSGVEEVSKQVEELVIDVQALSHRLHSAKLENLALVVTAAGFCRTFSKQQGVEIDFQSEGVPRELPPETSLCLFRVLQEAVQNAAKHSESGHFQVSIRGTSSEIELTVHDSGIGFEPEIAFAQGGLGLTSMRERLKLVKGRLIIDSRLQDGTTVCARVPYSL